MRASRAKSVAKTTEVMVPATAPPSTTEEETSLSEDSSPAMDPLQRITASSRGTPFERSVWTLLLQIPEGHFTTYGLMAAHLGSSPRAVGNALRRNPFAPAVPCHRCVASDRKLGGFKGMAPPRSRRSAMSKEVGITLSEKRELLRKEGVRFDGDWKVIGTPFHGFH